MVRQLKDVYQKQGSCNNCGSKERLTNFEECNHSPCGKYALEFGNSVYKPTLLCEKCKNNCSICKKIFCPRHLNSSGGRNYCDKCKGKM